MNIFSEKIKPKFDMLKPILPYGVLESWEDLNPRLYHAVHVYWLKFYGMWFNNFKPNNILFWIQLLYSFVVLWLVCFLPGIGEVVYLLKQRGDIGNIAEGLYLFLSEMYTYFKIASFWLHKNNILELLEYLHCDEFKPQEPEHRTILRKSIKRSRFVMTAYSSICVGAVSVGIIMPMTESFDILPTNVEYPFFDVYQSPAYEIIYLHHVYYKPATCIIDGVMDTILAAFITSASKSGSRLSDMVSVSAAVTVADIRIKGTLSELHEVPLPVECHIYKLVCHFSVGQIEILSFNLRNFDSMAERRQVRACAESNRNRAVPKEHYQRAVLRDCIIHHNSIIRYVSMIESAFSLASALQFMLSVMVLCLVGIQFLTIEEPTSHPMQMIWMVIYLTCMLIEVFILCWFGDQLIWKSMDIGNAAFEGPWLALDRSSNMLIIILLERCKRPLKVTAGKIFTLSLDTYTVLINWAYKAFAVMRNMKK